MQKETVSLKIGKEDLYLETGELARQADSSILVRYGGTVVLVSVCFSKEPKPGVNFLPLTVEYQEKTYAAGRIPGGFFKREGRPSESETLVARLIDRPLRPLFNKNIRNEIQIIAIVVSSDGSNDPDILSVIGASAAVSSCGVPFTGPVGACRVGRINGEFIVNPTYEEIQNSTLDVIVVGSKDNIVMMEASGKEESDDVMFAAIEFGLKQLPPIIDLQEELLKKIKKPALEITLQEDDENLMASISEEEKQEIRKAALFANKAENEEATKKITQEIIDKLCTEDSGIEEYQVKDLVSKIQEEGLRSFILKEKKRADGRKFEEIRQINCSVSVLPRTHGSSIFTRGQTQSLAVTTLGTRSDEQMIEALEGKTYESFLLHYSFPPFSVGEVSPMRAPSRREIGHGALARKALVSVMPSKDEFPYTVRVVSEILESNGSSSMASVCAATLSLMDAGVPIKAPVAGVALGLVKEGENFAILTDISGGEDHFGDMDFKIAGTKKGITAIQLDLKIQGISLSIIKKAIEQSRQARHIILDKISETLDAPRKSLSSYAPRIEILKINPEKIGELIGPGGKTIKKIINTTGVSIDIEDDGSVLVGSDKEDKLKAALDIIHGLVEEPEVGTIYNGRITKITNFGAFCEILPGKEGLIHISEVSDKYVKDINTVLKVGDEIKVKLVEIDELGRLNLSIKKARNDT
ncbi:MAG: polyribonucleotide nucleotidyltransferase [Candidatus Omnitrophota bacterium]